MVGRQPTPDARLDRAHHGDSVGSTMQRRNPPRKRGFLLPGVRGPSDVQGATLKKTGATFAALPTPGASALRGPTARMKSVGLPIAGHDWNQCPFGGVVKRAKSASIASCSIAWSNEKMRNQHGRKHGGSASHRGTNWRPPSAPQSLYRKLHANRVNARPCGD